MTQDPIDEAFQFVESVTEQPLITINSKKIHGRLYSRGKYYSLLGLKNQREMLNTVARGGFLPEANIITFFQRFNDELSEAVKTISHEYLHSTLFHIGEKEASQKMDKKYGVAEKEEEYGI